MRASASRVLCVCRHLHHTHCSGLSSTPISLLSAQFSSKGRTRGLGLLEDARRSLPDCLDNSAAFVELRSAFSNAVELPLGDGCCASEDAPAMVVHRSELPPAVLHAVLRGFESDLNVRMGSKADVNNTPHDGHGVDMFLGERVRAFVPPTEQTAWAGAFLLRFELARRWQPWHAHSSGRTLFIAAETDGGVRAAHHGAEESVCHAHWRKGELIVLEMSDAWVWHSFTGSFVGLSYHPNDMEHLSAVAAQALRDARPGDVMDLCTVLPSSELQRVLDASANTDNEV